MTVTGADNDTTVADTVASTTPTATSSLGSGDSAGATLFPSFRQMVLCVLTSIISPERTYGVTSGTFTIK
ncbi:Hypothetical predicted protein [Mytilus galloprovincialis]|uniref:Uncharacterized protein n=1 Tax=Mytilus galloprovincialis TaxID=29158 RepID=A0A8B6FP46_MYTGA|nr:Hypothetical predicted protein [Mytilus galloprovincialis]